MLKTNVFRIHDFILRPENKRCRKCKLLKPANPDFFYMDPQNQKKMTKICIPCQKYELKMRRFYAAKRKKNVNLNAVASFEVCYSVGNVSTLDAYTFLSDQMTNKDALKRVNSERKKMGLPLTSFGALVYAKKFSNVPG